VVEQSVTVTVTGSVLTLAFNNQGRITVTGANEQRKRSRLLQVRIVLRVKNGRTEKDLTHATIEFNKTASIDSRCSHCKVMISVRQMMFVREAYQQ